MPFSEFIRQYFNINLKDYPNIGIDFQISKVAFFIVLGLLIAIIIMNLRRVNSALLVKRLMRYEAFDEENAKTISELKVNFYAAKFVFLSGGLIKKCVRRVGEKVYSYEEYSALIKDKKYKEDRVDFKTERFYLDPKYKDIYTSLTEGASPTLISTVLQCILVISVYICLMFLAPEILTLINNLIQ